MKEIRYVLELCLLTGILFGTACIERGVHTYEAGRNDSNPMNTNVEVTSIDDPCWFRRPGALIAANDEMKSQRFERQELEMYGYKVDTPLKEAVKIFNEEMMCNPTEREYPRLTEEEVIAAIVEGVNDNGRREDFQAERDAFWAIAVKRILPKGAIIKTDGGAKMSGSPLAPNGFVQTKGIEIYIQLKADKNGRDELPPIPEPQEILTIRKTFFDFKINP
jgi:hypothetical protein